MMENRIYHLHALTALHVGIGQGSGIIDLPIARERASNLPIVPGSAVKGVLRDELRSNGLDDATWKALFGPEKVTDDDSAFAGSLVIGDARLLCLPVRSLRGTFAFATCPLVLRRYARDLAVVKESGVPKVIEISPGQYLTDSSTVLAEGEGDSRKVYLEDLDLKPAKGTDSWAEFIAKQIFSNSDETEWKKLFKERFIVLSDTEFDFLAETATEIRARVKLKEGTRTVQKGGLWYEENLPAESILWGLLAADRDFSKNETKLTATALLDKLPLRERLQIGGKATVGRGQVRWLLQKGDSK